MLNDRDLFDAIRSADVLSSNCIINVLLPFFADIDDCIGVTCTLREVCVDAVNDHDCMCPPDELIGTRCINSKFYTCFVSYLLLDSFN